MIIIVILLLIFFSILSIKEKFKIKEEINSELDKIIKNSFINDLKIKQLKETTFKEIEKELQNEKRRKKIFKNLF